MKLRWLVILLFLLGPVIADETPAYQIVVVAAHEGGGNLRLASAVAKALAQLNGNRIVQSSGQFTVSCSAVPAGSGVAVSIAILTSDGHLLTNFAQYGATIEGMAHDVAVEADRRMRGGNSEIQ
jgi:L-cysteine desulfidase